MTEPTNLYQFKSQYPPLLKQDAAEFQEINGELRLNGYSLATEDIVSELDEILKATDFETLKKELTLFVEDRRDFNYWLSEKLNMKNGHYDLD